MRASLAGIGSIGTMTNYEISTQRKSQMRVEEITTNQSTGQDLMNTTTTFYESPFHHKATRITNINSKGELFETKYKYALDFRIPSCDNSLQNCLQTYGSAATTAKNTFDYQLATCVNSGSCNCKWNAFQQYRRDISIARNNYVNCQLANKTTYTNCFQNNINAASVDLKPILELQNKYMNSSIEITSWKNNNLINASLTKYDYSSTVPGNVYPVKVQKINISTPSTNFTNASVNSNSLLVDTRYENEINIKYENGNVAEVIGKDGIITSYIWGYNYTLPIVKVTGVDYSTLQTAYTTVGGDLLQLRSQPTLANAFVSTYVYKPVVGITQETNPNGRNIYYEYDALGRLQLIRDHDNNIIKKICYNYAGQVENCNTPVAIFSSVSKSGSFTRNNCGTGYTGGAVTYTVAAGAYTSTLSQTDADLQAQNDVTNNGQGYANTNGTCTAIPANVTITAQNWVGVSGFTVVYTNTATLVKTTFVLTSAAGIQTLGTLAPGTYNVTISMPRNMVNYIYSVCSSGGGSGYSFTVNNITVSSTTCNFVQLDSI